MRNTSWCAPSETALLLTSGAGKSGVQAGPEAAPKAAQSNCAARLRSSQVSSSRRSNASSGLMPFCVALAGYPGAGKTSLALTLRQSQPDLVIVSRDQVKRALFGLYDVGDEQNAIAFSAVKQSLAVLLRDGHSVVVDGMTFSAGGQMEEVAAIAAQQRARFLPVYLNCSVDLASRRLAGPSDGTEKAAGFLLS